MRTWKVVCLLLFFLVLCVAQRPVVPTLVALLRASLEPVDIVSSIRSRTERGNTALHPRVHRSLRVGRPCQFACRFIMDTSNCPVRSHRGEGAGSLRFLGRYFGPCAKNDLTHSVERIHRQISSARCALVMTADPVRH